MKFQCPSKTFLVGEYAILNGGPAIILGTRPYFYLVDNKITDPYRGAGGFGASSARFVLKAFQRGVRDPWDAWEEYKSAGNKGSGADVVAQWMGGITFFYPREKKLEVLEWPFEELCIALIHTGNKLVTFRHLENLTLNSFIELEKIVLDTYAAIHDHDQEKLLTSIERYSVCLKELELVCEYTEKLLAKIKQSTLTLSTKGCGALGSDVILCVMEKTKKENFLQWADKENLYVIYCDNVFAKGVLCQP